MMLPASNRASRCPDRRSVNACIDVEANLAHPLACGVFTEIDMRNELRRIRTDNNEGGRSEIVQPDAVYHHRWGVHRRADEGRPYPLGDHHRCGNGRRPGCPANAKAETVVAPRKPLIRATG